MSETDVFQQQYRNTIGLFATGVTVLVAEQDGILQSMTANAISSLSLEPVQLLVCPSKTTRFAKLIKEQSSFTVNILGVHQEEVSNYFARPHEEISTSREYFDFNNITENFTAPRLKDCVASISCKVKHLYDGGDHWIVVGEVVDLYTNECNPQPLLYFAGGYHHPSSMAVPHLEPAADPYK